MFPPQCFRLTKYKGMGKIIMTGALGNVGGYVAHYAMENGEQVKAADIHLEALRAKYGDTAECAAFDFTNPSTFPAALEGVDRVFIIRPPHLGRRSWGKKSPTPTPSPPWQNSIGSACGALIKNISQSWGCST